VLVVALVGIVVNLAATYTLSKANRQSMNVEGAFQHILTDLAAFIFTAIAGVVILTTGFHRADGIASLVIAAIMLRAAYGLLKASGRVFLEAAPQGLDPDAIGRALVNRPGVAEVHDLHVWEVTSGFPALSAHVLVGQDSDCHKLRRQMERILYERFGVQHTTLQADHEGGELLDIEIQLSAALRPRLMRSAWPATAALLGVAALTGCGNHPTNDRELLGQGRHVFVAAGCGACHTVAAAHTHGRIGPDFDTSEQLNCTEILLQLNAGGGGMPSFRDSLTTQQKNAVTEFVFDVLHQRRRAPSG
jgi:mono/diheme cytochrome c family protein